VPSDEIPLEMDDEDEGGDGDTDAAGDVDMDADDRQHGAFQIRPSSPDMSWLPPLPGDGPPPAPISSLSRSPSRSPEPGPIAPLPSSSTSAPAPKADKDDVPLITKYLTLVPASASSLAPSEQFLPGEGPEHAVPTTVHRPPPARTRVSTLPALMAAYEALNQEGTAFFQRTELRQQAHRLLAHSICPADFDTPEATLTYPLPGPRVSMALPSYPEPSPGGGADADDPPFPIPALLVNPHPTGILSRLVREMRSPFLPPALRKELLHLSPPPAQMQKGPDGEKPVLYDEPVRGPDRASLAEAHGKPAPVDPGAQRFYRYTFDTGRQPEMYARKLVTTGKKVVQSGVGEETPRAGPVFGDEADVGEEVAREPAAPRVEVAVDADADEDAEGEEDVDMDGTTHMSVPAEDVVRAVKDTHVGAAGPAGEAAAGLLHAASDAMGVSAPAADPSAGTNTPRISLAPPRLRISTASLSPNPAASTHGPSASPSLSPAPPPAHPTAGTPSPLPGGLKLRLGGGGGGGGGGASASVPAASSASPGAKVAVHANSSPGPNPMSADNAPVAAAAPASSPATSRISPGRADGTPTGATDAAGAASAVARVEGEPQTAAAPPRPAFKIRLSASGAGHGPGNGQGSGQAQ
jgi:hypothetical protein